MRTVNRRPVLLRWKLSRRPREAHVVVVVLQRRQGLRLRIPHLRLLLLLLAALCSLHDLRGAILVCWVVKQGTNIVHEKRVKKFSNLLLVGKIQGSLKRNPAAVLVPLIRSTRFSGTDCTYQTPFKCIGPIFTTCRIFSLFRMPSRLPLVMPATLSSLVPLIM